MSQILQAMLLGDLYSEKGGRKMCSVSAHIKQEDLLWLKGLLEAGKLTPVIDRSFPLSETAEALRYIGAGHARGKVVISM